MNDPYQCRFSFQSKKESDELFCAQVKQKLCCGMCREGIDDCILEKPQETKKRLEILKKYNDSIGEFKIKMQKATESLMELEKQLKKYRKPKSTRKQSNHGQKP